MIEASDPLCETCSRLDAQGGTVNEGRRLRASLLAWTLSSAATAMACGDAKSNADQEAEIEDAGSLAPDDDADIQGPPLDAGEEEKEPEPTLEGTLAIVEADSVLSGTETRTPTVGLDVVVNRADGSLAFHGKTGADGRLEVRVPEDGSVSLLTTTYTRNEDTYKVVTSRSVRTWVAPPDGHVIHKRDVTYAPAAQVTPNKPMKIVFPAIDAENAPAGTAYINLIMPCFDNSWHDPANAMEFSEYTGCAGSDTYDVIMFAQNAAGANLGYATLLNQPLKPGETVTHALQPTQTAFAETTTTLAMLPQGATYLQFEMYTMSATRPGFRIGHHYQWPTPAATQTAVLRIPAGVASRFQTTESLLMENSHETFRRDRTGNSPPVSFTVSPSSLARVTSLDPTNIAVLSRPSLAFSLASTGSREGCVQTDLKWEDTASIETRWFSYQAAGTASSARFPELPEALAEYAPQNGAWMGNPTIENRHIVGRVGLVACETAQDDDESLTWSRRRN